MAIPDHILLKPGKLDPAEIAIIRTHAEVGARILADSHCELIQLGAIIAVAHHERWDGSGYPRGLKGTEIPTAARFVTVADVFDALTTRRPYKEAMQLWAARDYLLDKRGHEFDPACVDAFLARWSEAATIATGMSAPQQLLKETEGETASAGCL